MKKGVKDQIKGSIFILIFIGIPLSFVFTPVVIIAIVVGALFGIVREGATKDAASKPARTSLSKEDQELITAILPVINRK